PAAVSVEFLEILVQRRISVVEELIPDFSKRPFGHIDVLVNETGVVAQLAPEQTDRLVSAPASVSYLLAEEEIAAWNAERGRRARDCDDVADFFGELRRATLVGIENNGPSARRPVDPLVTERSD